MLYAWSLITHVDTQIHTQWALLIYTNKKLHKGAYLKISSEMFDCDQPGLVQLRTSERAKIDLEPAVLEPGRRRNRFNILNNHKSPWR